jgi:hypothetical protein
MSSGRFAGVRGRAIGGCVSRPGCGLDDDVHFRRANVDISKAGAGHVFLQADGWVAAGIVDTKLGGLTGSPYSMSAGVIARTLPATDHQPNYSPEHRGHIPPPGAPPLSGLSERPVSAHAH